MIVPMKKAAVIVQPKDAEEAIRKLRSLGVMHVENQQSPAGKDITSLKDDIAMLEKVTGILSAPGLQNSSGIKDATLLKDWRFAAKHIIDIYARADHLEEYGRGLALGIAQWEPWGDFDPESVRELAGKGIKVKLYEIPAEEMDRIPAGVVVKKIAIVKKTAYCVAVSRDDVVLPFKEVQPPKMGLGDMKARLVEDEAIKSSLKKAIRQYTCFAERFRQIHAAFIRELEFHEAVRGMASSEQITYITGYVPFDAVPKLFEEAKKRRWGAYATDPSDEDNVPTMIRNPRWVSIVSPVFKLIEIVPGYKELDISFWFLIFFSIFFGMLIGDAGYGAIFILLTGFAQYKWGKKAKTKSIFYLFYMLSACAIIWGLLTGTVFGQEWLPTWYKPLVPALRDDKTVQALCFLIGAIHMSIAHIWRAILKAPSAAALADIGWTSILWGGYFLARLLVLGESFPAFGSWFFIVGAILVTFFTSPQKNILKGAGEGLGALALNFVNSFTDVVSYIRLFAVGLATVAVADSFNMMARDIGFGSIFAGIATALVLLLGHSLNIVLGPMSVLVHGVRLNVLEFCGHLSITWSGFSYKPLKE